MIVNFNDFDERISDHKIIEIQLEVDTILINEELGTFIDNKA